MKKEDADEMYRKWRESKGIVKGSDVENDTETEESENPFETKAVGIGFTEDEGDEGWKWVLFSFEGNLERRRYIIGTIGMLIAMIIMWIIGIVIAFGAFTAGDNLEIEGDRDGAGVWYLFGIIIFLGVILISLISIWPDAAMATKRLRDMGQEPGLAALFVLLPLVPFVGGLAKLGMWIWLMVVDTEKKTSWTPYQSNEESPKTEE